MGVLVDGGAELFVQRHARSLFGTAYVLTGDADQAQDLLQDTLVRLVPKWGLVEAAADPLAYARRMLVNQYMTSKRRRRVPQIGIEAAAELRDCGSAPDDVAINRALVRALLDTLPDRQRAALVMRYLYGDDDAEIARVLGCRGGTVRSLISRALATLRDQTSERSNQFDLSS